MRPRDVADERACAARDRADVAGFSGHGYEMSSVIGQIAADLAMTGESAFELELFSPHRFARS
jgi:glycine/D-amino acid oxidase-like deaminating enzyme